MRRRVIPLCLVALGAMGGCDRGPAAPHPQDDRSPVTLPDTVDLVSFADVLRDAMPGEGSGGYTPPQPAEVTTFLLAVDEALTGQATTADSLLAAFGYDVVYAVDGTLGDSLLFVIERTPVERGWGTYVWNTAAAVTPATVHVDHPLYDLDTPQLAAMLYVDCRCRGLYIAGTHRYADPNDISDMARSTSSVFQAMHEHLAVLDSVAVSVHGFAAGNHAPPTSESDAVLSNGATSAGVLGWSPAALALRDTLRGRGYTVGLVAYDPAYTDLTGSPNPQGRYSNDTFGYGRWVHIELSRPVRETPESRAAMAAAITAWLVPAFRLATPNG